MLGMKRFLVCLLILVVGSAFVLVSTVIGASALDDGGNGEPNTYTQEPRANLPMGFCSQAQLRCAMEGKVLTFGGYKYQGTNPAGIDHIYEYDIASDTWILRPERLPYGLWATDADIAGNGKVYMPPAMGPNTNNGWGTHNRMIEYDPVTGTAVEKAAYPFSAIWDVSICADANGDIYTFGGWTGVARTEVFQYDYISDQVTQVSSLQGGQRAGIASVLGNDGSIYLFGGGYWDLYRRVVEVFDPVTHTCAVIPVELPFDGGRGESPIAWPGDGDLIYLLDEEAGDLYVFQTSDHSFTLVQQQLVGIDTWARPTLDRASGQVFLVAGRLEGQTYSDKTWALVPVCAPWGNIYGLIFGRTGLETALSALREYRDKIIVTNQHGKQMVDELYGDYSDQVANILLAHPKLMVSAAELVQKHLSGVRSVLDGGRMEITSLQLLEVKRFLSDLAKFGDLGLKRYIGSVQRMLNKKGLEPFGIKVVSRASTAPPVPEKGHLTATWGSIKNRIRGQ